MFYNQKHGLLWTGDVLFKGSIGRTDFPKGNHQQLLDSIKENALAYLMKLSLFRVMVQSTQSVTRNNSTHSLQVKLANPRIHLHDVYRLPEVHLG